jgi:hypothetical protein
MKTLTKLSMNTVSWTVIWASLATLALYLVPFLSPLSYPFMLLSTLVHEMGHGFSAMLLGGHFESFKMWSDGSGVASISGSFGAFSKALVSAAGLLGPALVSAVFFWGTSKESRARFLLASFAIILVLSIMLVVRNLFGIFFVAVIAAGCFYFSLGAGKKYCQAVLAFLAAELALSVFSRSDYLFTKYAQTSAGLMPSDVEQIAQNLFLPYWFWGAVCGILSVAVLILGFRQSLKA